MEIHRIPWDLIVNKTGFCALTRGYPYASFFFAALLLRATSGCRKGIDREDRGSRRPYGKWVVFIRKNPPLLVWFQPGFLFMHLAAVCYSTCLFPILKCECQKTLRRCSIRPTHAYFEENQSVTGKHWRTWTLICFQVPTAVVNFKWDPLIMKDILATQGQVDENAFLKPELLQLVQELKWQSNGTEYTRLL